MKRFLRQVFRKSRFINHEPLNKVSLIVIIIIDLFVLFNVFAGLNNISGWHLSPTEVYPCRVAWDSYRNTNLDDRDYRVLRLALAERAAASMFKTVMQQTEIDRLGQVSQICLDYAERQDQVNRPENQSIQTQIEQKQTEILRLEQANNNIRSQYDSTLLDKIAGQDSNQSINQVSAEQAKQTLEQNQGSISNLKAEITVLKAELAQKLESIRLLNLVRDDALYRTLQKGQQQASFWYPSIQLSFQALFLLPLIAIALFVHRVALRRRSGLIALMSWHFLVIFFIPLLLKIFEFMQIGAIFKVLFDWVAVIFGRLLFLVNYLYILMIPLVGFGIIKLAQTFVLNRQSQVTQRVQKRLCLGCAKKIRDQDAYCPHCGYAQYIACQNCHEMTYKHLSHCRSCGYGQTAPTTAPNE